MRLRFKVLFLASWFPNRVDPVVGNFIKKKVEAVSRLCDVAVIHVAKDPSLKRTSYETEVKEEKNIKTVIVYFKPSSIPMIRGLLYNLRYFKSYFLGWLIIKEQWGLPDLLHVNVIERAGYFALLIRFLRHIPYVITEHSTPDIDFVKGLTRGTIIRHKFFQSLVYKNSGFANVDSRASLEYLQKAGFRANFCIIPNVVDIEESLFLQRKQKQSEKKIALHISNLIERKNVADMIRAFSLIYSTREDFEFHIVGEGAMKRQLVELARHLGTLDKCIFFHGYVSDEEKVQLLLNSDFHVLNSNEEGFSVATAEAVCYGAPVIATRCGGPEDFVTEDVGLLIERKNINQLENAIRQMLDTCRNYDRRVLEGHGKKRFSPAVVAEQTYEMYRKTAVLWKAGNTSHSIRIESDWRVLDVGSGHQPNRRANVLLERYLEETIHRTTQRVVVPPDRHLVVGDGLQMPFQDRSFDYVVASHIAEHVDDPLQLCRELQRVAKRGYIETPGPLTEYLLPTASHKWTVSKKGNGLRFKKNNHQNPPSRLFFRFFYLNRDGYGSDTLKSDNFILKALNLAVIKVWPFLPGSYTKLEWNDRFESELAGDGSQICFATLR